MDETQPKNHHYLLIGFSLILLIIAGTFVWQNFLKKTWLSYQVHNSNAIEQKLKEANDAHDSGNYKEAIDNYSKILGDVSNPLIKVKIQAKIASNLEFKDQDNDQDVERGIAIQKSIILDEKNPASIRALVVNELANFLTDSFKSELFIRKNFTEDLFVKMMPNNSTRFDATDFGITLYKYSDNLYPNTFAKFAISYKLAKGLSGKYGKISSNVKEDALAIKKNIDDGDKLIGDLVYEPGQIVKFYFYRSVAMQAIHTNANIISFDDVKNAYKNALSEGMKYTDSLSVKNRVWIRFHYAEFLRRQEKPTPNQEIMNIIDPIVNGEEGKNGYVRTILSKFSSVGIEESYTRTSLNNLASAYPSFKDYLEGLGWAFK